MNLALDRIASIESIPNNYIESSIDPEEYFDDIVGVSIPRDGQAEKITLKINGSLWPYIRSKPIHGSQKKVEITEDYAIISIEIMPNYEFYSLLLSYGDGIELLAPKDVRAELFKRIKSMQQNYK